MSYTLPKVLDYSLEDMTRFCELSIRQGSPWSSLLENDPQNERVLVGAYALMLLDRAFSAEEALSFAQRFLKEAGDWMRVEPDTLWSALQSSGFLRDEEGNRFRVASLSRPGVTYSRLLDELDSARSILTMRRARLREALQTKNRQVNAPQNERPQVETPEDRQFMALAIEEAKKAEELDEVPIGSVVVLDGKVIASGFNRTRTDADPTAHAEVLALREAARALGNARLPETTLYVTVEPCPMCAGAIMQARCARVVFGASDEKIGALGSALNLFTIEGMNHKSAILRGVLADEAKALMQEFFQRRREEEKAP